MIVDALITILKIWAVGAVITMLLLSMVAAIYYKWEKFFPEKLPEGYSIRIIILQMSLLWPAALALTIAMAVHKHNNKE